MAFCKKCGKENEDFSKFCISCGNVVLTYVQAIRQAENTLLWEKKTIENDISIRAGQAIHTNAKEHILMDQVLPEKKDRQTPVVATLKRTGSSNPERNPTKIIVWTICILLFAGIGLFFLFRYTTILNKHVSIPDDQQEIQPKVVSMVVVTKVDQPVDSTISSTTGIDSSVAVPVQTKVVKEKEVVAEPVAEKINTAVPVAIPASPTRQMAVNDLEGKQLCNDLVFSRNANVISYTVSGKTIDQCNAIIAFKMGNSDVKYTVNMMYKNKAGSYIYGSNTCSFKAPVIGKPVSPVRTPSVQKVKGDLINHLKQGKIFGGIRYNNISEITIVKINPRVYYAESGVSSYMVELLINNVKCKSQVNYTIDGNPSINFIR